MFPNHNTNLVKIVHVSSYTSNQVQHYLTDQLPPVSVLDSDGNNLLIPVSDVYDLFNQDRLSGFSQDVIDTIRSNIMASSPYADEISKLSDAEIFDSIRPRQIQSPSELVQWSKYIQGKIEAKLSIAHDAIDNAVKNKQNTDNQSASSMKSTE